MGDQCQFGVCHSRGRPGKRLNSIGEKIRFRPRFDIEKKQPKTLEKVFKELLGLCSIYRVLEFEPLIVHGI